VDGAQTFGALKLDLGRMECDVFTASSHKWFVGPKEAGLMYVKASSQERLWPSDVGVGWESAREEGARKFENMGQRDDAAVVTMATTVAFHEAIGPEAMEDRVRALATRALEGLEGRLSGVAFHTPLRPELRAGVVVFRLPGTDHDDLHEALYRERGVASAPMHGAFEGLRFSPHVYNTAAEVDEAVEAVVAVAGNRPAAGS
jgi:selenocysteine lyase/cysteine desulfurase